MKSSLFVLPLLAVGILTPSWQPATGAPSTPPVPSTAKNRPIPAKLVVPGRSVGELRIGDTRAAARRKLGAPGRSYTRPDGYVVDQWVGRQQVQTDVGPQHSLLTVLYGRSRIVQIEFNSSAFATQSNLSTASKLRDFYRVYPRPRHTAYVYASEDREVAHEYFDAQSAGLCAQITAQDTAMVVTIQRLIVHVPGKKVIPEPKGEAVDAEQPASG